MIKGVGFQLDAGAGALGAQFVDGDLEGGQVAIGGQVVVFDHGMVVKAHAVIGAAAGFHGSFFNQAPAGGCFPRVPDLHGVRFHGFHVALRLGGHAAETLEEVQRRALGSEQGAGAAGGLHQDAAPHKRAAIGNADFHFERRIDLLEDSHGDFSPGDDAGLTGNDFGPGA